MPDIETRIRASFAKQALMETFGASILAISDGQVTLIAPILPLATQQHGFAHAGLTFALADSAAGYAALTTMPDRAEVLTTEMKINLLAPAQGDRLVAEGRVLKPGRRLVIVASDVYAETDGSRRHIATTLGTMIPVVT